MQMSQSLIYILLLFALVLPVLGAILLRVLGSRLSPTQLYGAAGSIFAVVLVSVLLLARSDVPSLQIGALSVLLPVSAPEDIGVAIPVADLPTSGATLEEPTANSTPTSVSENAPTSEAATPVPTESRTEAPTEAPTLAATAAPEPTVAPTIAPTAAPTAAPPAPSEPRKYTVQPGDTLRAIAEKYNVSVTAIVDANKLTPQEADSLRVGQELVIPTP
jgi:LysM repeat protein